MQRRRFPPRSGDISRLFRTTPIRGERPSCPPPVSPCGKSCHAKQHCYIRAFPPPPFADQPSPIMTATDTSAESQPFQAEVSELLHLMVHSVYSETSAWNGWDSADVSVAVMMGLGW